MTWSDPKYGIVTVSGTHSLLNRQEAERRGNVSPRLKDLNILASKQAAEAGRLNVISKQH